MHTEDKAWIDYRERFSTVYDDANYSSPLQKRVMGASHKLVEKHCPESSRYARVVEIGAGTGEHLQYVRHQYDEYVITDMDPAALDVAKQKVSAHGPGKLRFEVQVGSELAYADHSFDRVVAVHVLEHIFPPHIALKEWARVLKPGGLLSVLIPTDPGMAWRLGRHLGPRKNALAQGIAYDYIMAREHVNSCTNLIAILKHYFPDSVDAWWPFPIPSVDVNLFYAFHARVGK